MRLSNQDGQGMTEYLILMLLVSLVSVAAARALGNTIKSKIKEARNHINKEISLKSTDVGGDDENFDSWNR